MICTYFSTKLGELSVDELKSILNDEDRFEKFIMDIDSEHHPLGNKL